MFEKYKCDSDGLIYFKTGETGSVDAVHTLLMQLQNEAAQHSLHDPDLDRAMVVLEQLLTGEFGFSTTQPLDTPHKELYGVILSYDGGEDLNLFFTEEEARKNARKYIQENAHLFEYNLTSDDPEYLDDVIQEWIDITNGLEEVRVIQTSYPE